MRAAQWVWDEGSQYAPPGPAKQHGQSGPHAVQVLPLPRKTPPWEPQANSPGIKHRPFGKQHTPG